MGNFLRLTRYLYEALGILAEIRAALELIRSIQEQMLEVQKALKVEPQPERMLRAKEVAVLLNVNPKTIWNWKKKGTLVPVPIGSHEYFPESAVLRLKS